MICEHSFIFNKLLIENKLPNNECDVGNFWNWVNSSALNFAYKYNKMKTVDIYLWWHKKEEISSYVWQSLICSKSLYLILQNKKITCFSYLLRFRIIVFQLKNVFDLSLLGTSSRGFEIKAKGKRIWIIIWIILDWII